MTDIVEDLRKGDPCGDCKRDRCRCVIMEDAADVIEMLRENMQNLVDEVERLRDALTEIEYLDRPQVRGKPRRVSIQEIALAALDINND